MYDGLVALLRKKYDKAPMVMEAADAIEELSKQNEKWEEVVKTALDFIPCWIPVTERLPVKGEWVLTHSKFVRPNTDFIDKHGSWYRTPAVTHWMPLPEPPKEEV